MKKPFKTRDTPYQRKVKKAVRDHLADGKKKKAIRDHIPLFQVLKELKNYQRQIIVDHLDPSSCKHIRACISTVLNCGHKVNDNKHIKYCVRTHKPQLQQILRASKFRGRAHKRALARIGGNPLYTFLSFALPLLLEMI